MPLNSQLTISYCMITGYIFPHDDSIDIMFEPHGTFPAFTRFGIGMYQYMSSVQMTFI